ncbi:MAG: hypothetical protein ABI846_13005 [Rudaea sp.]
MTKPSANATLALLNQGGGIGSELCAALRVFGADVVYEAPLQALDRAALSASGARIVVINLVDNEDALDDIQDLLDSDDYEIIVNDNAVSAQLTGPEQARWVRHLAAKILRRPDIVLPARPEGAEAPPTFEQHWAARVPVAETIRAEQPPAPDTQKATAMPPAAATSAANAVAVAASEAAPAAAESMPQTHEENIEAALASIEQITIESGESVSPEEIDGESLSFSSAPVDLDVGDSLLPVSAEFAAVLAPIDAEDRYDDVADFEALLAAAHELEAVEQPTTQERQAIVEREVLSNLDFESIDSAISVEPETAKRAAAKPVAAVAAPAALKVPAPDWSLAPAEEAVPTSSEFGIEKVPADVYLAPQVEEAKAEPVDPKDIGATIPRGFAGLELVPLEVEEDTKPKNTVAYDTGRDLDPANAPKPPKKDDATDTAKDS